MKRGLSPFPVGGPEFASPLHMSPRRARAVETGCWFHVVNRAVNRQRIFRSSLDYDTLLAWFETALTRFPVKCGGYCLMPNHFHLLVSPGDEGALSRFMHLALGGHAADFRASTGTNGYGHVYQGRYWSRHIATDGEYLRVLRYVEANALRAGLVARAEDWQWSSLWGRAHRRRVALAEPPVDLPPDWSALVNCALPQEALEAIRHPTRRGRRPRADAIAVREAGGAEPGPTR